MPENEDRNVHENEDRNGHGSEAMNVPENDGMNVPENDGMNGPGYDDMNVPESGDMNVSESGDMNVPGNDDMNAPESGGMNVPENGDMNVPEDGYMYVAEDDGTDVAEEEGTDVPERDGAPVPEGSAHADPGQAKKRYGWKSVLLAVAIFIVIGSLAQAVIRDGGFGGALDTTGGGDAPKKEHQAIKKVKKPKKPKTVVLGNKKIPRQSGAIIVVNPGLVVPGGKATVEGAGFDAKSTVELLIKSGTSNGKGQSVATVKADRVGAINSQFTMPEKGSSKSATLVAQQRGSSNVAEAQVLSGSGVGAVKINKAAGRPGDSVALTVRGFGPGEAVDVYWGRVSGQAVTTLQADPSGGIGRASVKVGVAPTGSGTLVLVGRKSKTTATAPFEMLGLYPTLKSSPFALKSGERINLSAGGFAPEERVLVYINSAGGIPAFSTKADANGNVGAVGFDVPFGLKGEQNLTAIGDQTRAVVRSGFQVLPYTPTAEPSAYGGKAGTTLSFYVTGFAPKETVTLYAGGTNGGGGKKVSTFQVDDRGEAEAAGQYRITKEDENGVAFRLIGQKSGGTAQAGVNSSEQGGQGGSGGQK